MVPRTLRLTDIPTRPSRIVIFTLTLPQSKEFLQGLANSTHFGVSPTVIVEPTRTTESSPESQELYSSNIEHDPDGSSSPNTTPEPGTPVPQSSSPPLPPPPPPPEKTKYQSLDEMRIEAARDAVVLFRSWAREDISEELKEVIAVRNASETEAELLQKIMWVKECLRGRYQIWIQRSEAYNIEGALRSTRGNKDHEVKMLCGYPGCGRTWDDGEIRVSFEPHGWTTSEKVKGAGKKKKKVTFDLDNEMMDEEEDSMVIDENEENLNDAAHDSKGIKRLPDYHALLKNPRNTRLHGRGEFFCLHCFEKLLVPPAASTSPTKKRKRENRKYLRPNPLCRIYGSVFPETRLSADGKFQLDVDMADLVERWKDALFAKGIKNLKVRFGEYLGSAEEDPEEAEEDPEEAEDREVGDGRGLAELLGTKNVEPGGIVKRKK
ncbi:uncharacterized protein H6S33_005968 [Morchella sextelata]|uniref:uncharacterized protein n=1 Tax=Morchella sextelata TaxID=1174677 RepID=UPI001D048724|nr:uncharacterized protein H6S33_005968 [Morchella sextelata]KAH0614082.1 hypothetical protein H6S33_005968 [Morchella sextelata]